MNFKTIALGLVALASAGSASAAVNLVTNGSFEADNYGFKTGFQGNVTGWSGGGGLTFLATPGSADDLNQYLAIYGPFPATSPDGGNFILADGDPDYRGAFLQDLTGLTVGKKYVVSFYQAAGQQAGFTGPTTERWDVSFGGVTQASNTFSLPEGGVGLWELQKLTFTANAATQTLTFLASGTPGGAPPISLLDGISVAGVPEASTWAMLIAGFGLVGAAARRRRMTTVAA
jgi:hypothetical protein